MLDNDKFDNSLKQALINQALLPLDSNSSWFNFEINYKYNEKGKYINDLPLRKEIDKFVLKSKRGIYVLVDSTSEEVLYVGEGWVRNRLHEHIKNYMKINQDREINSSNQFKVKFVYIGLNVWDIIEELYLKVFFSVYLTLVTDEMVIE
ncbi:hypothetical protein [Bacillus cereus]|uniref:hypothetical protein n=1 Tax=Bacillus cereus TaxID=1396 RepID=UPI001F15956D|nr:hypothetical protein [Bacillus cereus]